MEIVALISLIFGLLFLLFIMINKNNENRIKSIESNLQNKGFSFSKKILGIGNRYIFGIDENKKCLVYSTEHLIKSVPFKDIVSVEVIQDGKTIHKKSLTRTIGGAVIGGVVAGGAGSIIGGLSGSSKENNRISKILVKIVIRDISNPTLVIPCFDANLMTAERKPLSVDDFLCKTALSQANSIKDSVSVIIDMIDRGIIVNDNREDLIKETYTEEDLIKELIKSKGLIQTVEVCVKEKGMSLNEAMSYVKHIKEKHNL